MASDTDYAHSEHDFLAFCAKIEQDSRDWETLKINFAQQLKQRELLRDIGNAPTHLKAVRELALGVFRRLNDEAQNLKTDAVSYIFSDNDILFFAEVPNLDVRTRFDGLQEETLQNLPPNVHLDHFNAGQHIKTLKNFADEKMRTARQMRAMISLITDTSRKQTVPIQRQNRQLPLVMLVEDDRFTATYTAQLLSKNYDVFHVRTGEEAIEYYLSYAPDAVFIDMHLPGISGADTMQMIKAMDPEAYCVIMSVDTSRATVMLASGDGANGYLRKPYNKERLLWTVRQSPHIRDLPLPINEIVHT